MALASSRLQGTLARSHLEPMEDTQTAHDCSQRLACWGRMIIPPIHRRLPSAYAKDIERVWMDGRDSGLWNMVISGATL